MGQNAEPVSSDLKGIEKRRLKYILRELSKTGAFLFSFKDMSQAAIFMRGTLKPIMSVTAKEMWALVTSGAVEYYRPGKVSLRYRIASEGRGTLARLQGLSAPRAEVTPFAAAHAIKGHRRIVAEGGKVERKSVNLGESPLGWLARRHGADGKGLLDTHHVDAGERLRADFERGQLGPKVTQNWESLLAPVDAGSGSARRDVPATASEARDRLHKALNHLGPGLADVVFRVCCFGTGMEKMERDHGWAARSGKVVLKIALDRLAIFYGIKPHDPTAEAKRTPAPKGVERVRERAVAC